MKAFFDILSYYGGILAMLVFISGFIILILVKNDVKKEKQKTNETNYEWEDLE